MRTRGSSNIIGLLLIAAVVVGLYLVVMLAPTYTDNMDVQHAVDAAVNQVAHDDSWIKRNLQDSLRYVGTHKEEDGFGNVQVAQGLGFTDDDIQIDRDEVNNTISVSIDYSREVELKPFHKILTLHFHPHKTGSLK